MTKLRKGLITGAAGLGALVAYFLAWPIPVRPVAWTPPPPQPLADAYAVNDRLAGYERLLRDKVHGPEAFAVDAEGLLYTGTRDGKIVQFKPDGSDPITFGTTGGRPLGLAFGAKGEIIVADAYRGLVSVSPAGNVRPLAESHEGDRFKFVDDVAVASDGTIYFTDASRRFGLEKYLDEILEHSMTGRVLSYTPATKKTAVLVDGLEFANGIALAPDESYLLVTETSGYRIRRHWLAGPRQGQTEPLIENLPGFPDNITWSPSRKLYWVALGAPRNEMLDRLGPHPMLRGVVARLPKMMRPKANRHAIVLGITPDGRVVENLQDASPDAYAPIASVREHAGHLYLGSFERAGIARVKAP